MTARSRHPMSAIRRVLPTLTAAVALSCNNGAGQLEFSGATMGTAYTVKIPLPSEPLPQDSLQRDIRETVDRIEMLASTYLVTSELSAFNTRQSTDWLAVSAELCGAVADALAISRETEGAFDITVGPLVNLWGFGPGEIVIEPPPQARIEAELQRVGHEKLETDCSKPAMRKHRADLYLDLSGWAKGHAVDELAALLDSYDLADYLVEIGGELRVHGRNAQGRMWGVAIEKPDEARRAVQTVVRVTDVAVATSGDYRNFFEFEGKRYSHTIDPRTGWPVDHALAAVTVLHPSAAVADAMATALLVLGPDSGPALAEQLGLAATFLVRGRGGAEQRSTAAFESMVAR